MRGSSQKDLAVYDFDEDEEAVEALSRKNAARIQSRLNSKSDEAVTKYSFLQAFTSGLNLKQGDANDDLCIDLHKRDNARESHSVDTPERNLASTGVKTELDEMMTSSTSYDEDGHVSRDEFEPQNPAEKRPLVTGASSLVVPSLADGEFSELPRDGMGVDVTSDDEESWASVSGSPSSTASDMPENEGYLEHPISDDCYTAFGGMVDNDMAVRVSPDYVIYGNTLYGESQLTFSADCIKIECSDSCANDEKLALECGVADVIHFYCQWSGSVHAALITLHLKANALAQTENVQKDSQAVKVKFALADFLWLAKEQKIKNLAARYRDIWNIGPNDDLVEEDDMLRPNMFFSKQNFIESEEPIEDIIYPKGDPDAVSISKRDIELLQPETFINDTIIDFYIKYLKNKIQPHEKHRFHFFNSFFFRKLADLDKDPNRASESRAAFLRVRKWTRKVNIFEKDYIFIPVNFNLHWSLLVICHPGEVVNLKDDDIKESVKVPCILHMDSIKGSHSGLKNIIQSYLWEEWKERHPESSEDISSEFSNLRFVPLELPQQENSFDCGLFLLHYVELFLEEAPVNFSPFKVTKFSSFLSSDWFSPAEASVKRTFIRNLICELLRDPSQKVAQAAFSSAHLPSGYPEKGVEQEPVVEYLSGKCSSGTPVVSDSLCPGNGEKVEMNPPTLASPGDAQCNDKQPGPVLHEFLEPGETAMSRTCQQDASCQMLNSTTCPIVEHADTIEQLVSSTLERDEGQTLDACPNTQICSTSYPVNDVGACETSWRSSQKFDVEAFPSSESPSANPLVSDQKGESEIPESFFPEKLGYVPDSPTLSSGERLGSSVEDSQEIGSSKKEVKDIEGSQGHDITKTDGEGNEDYKGIATANTEIRDGQNCQKLHTAKASTVDIEDCEEVDAIKADYGDGEVCHESNSTKAIGFRGESQDTCTTEAGSGASADDPCQEDHLITSCHIVITVDENSDKDDKRPTDSKLEQQHQKRRRVMRPEGGRMRTRSFSRDCTY